jgi:3-dehydroquinate dehydratase/shikimate dehydrogenase
MTAYNTDYRAAMASIDKRLENRESKEPLAGKTALILGAGGAAKAMAAGLQRRGASIIVAGRTRSRADSLAGRVGGRAVDWDNRYYVKADLVVNCTPVGMHPNVDETPFDMHHLRPNSIVFDTVYNPEQTMFVKEARQRNCQTISGVDMFIGQAALQFKHFTGQDPPVDVMRQQFKRAIGAAKF